MNKLFTLLFGAFSLSMSACSYCGDEIHSPNGKVFLQSCATEFRLISMPGDGSSTMGYVRLAKKEGVEFWRYGPEMYGARYTGPLWLENKFMLFAGMGELGTSAIFDYDGHEVKTLSSDELIQMQDDLLKDLKEPSTNKSSSRESFYSQAVYEGNLYLGREISKLLAKGRKLLYSSDPDEIHVGLLTFQHIEAKQFKSRLKVLTSSKDSRISTEAKELYDHLIWAEGTVLHSCIEKKDVDCLRRELNQGISANSDLYDMNISRVTALLLAAETDAPRLVEMLLKEGAKPDRIVSKPQHGFDRVRRESALGAAAASASGQVVSLLLKYGANVNFRDLSTGWTPLMRAVWAKKKANIQVLLAAKADRRIRDKDGKTAMDHARESGDSEIIGALGER